MNQEQLQKLPAVLFEIGKLVGSDLDPGVLLARISELVCHVINAEACSVMLLDASRERLLAKAAYGLRAERMHTLSFGMGEGIAGWVALHGEAVLLANAADDPRYIQLPNAKTPIGAMICVPLVARGMRVGVVTATTRKTGTFNDSDLEILRFVAATIALDIENVRLHRVAVTDPLTAAFNREFLGARLPSEIDAALERDRPLSIAMVDIDHFKKINDQFGHGVGDVVLAEVATRLRAAIRHGDMLVRYGGEEFLVILPRAGADRANEVGHRMRERTSESPIVTAATASSEANLRVTVSVGVAELRRAPAETMTDFIARADAALYASKAAGRNRVTIAPSAEPPTAQK